MIIEPISSRVKVEELRNYGLLTLRQLYTISVNIELAVEESPDMIHRALTDTGLISRTTIPFEVVSNFRGSITGKPYYEAVIMHDGIEKRYRVLARDTGGLIRARIDYEPMIEPEELRLIHPAEFARMGIEVKEWELHNYRHYFILFIASGHYESFDIAVKRGTAHNIVEINLTESDLQARKVPCSWYLERLRVFAGLKAGVTSEIQRTN